MTGHERKLKLAGKLILVVAITFLALSIGARTDISLFDESIYLSQGLGQLPDFGQYERSPLYSLYYYLLNLKIADPLNLYVIGSTLNIISSISLLLITIYTLTRSLALCAITLILLVSSNLIEVWPYISFLAISLISLGTILVFRSKSLLDACSISALAFFLLCFIRPEFVISFYAALVLTIGIAGFQLTRALKGDFLGELTRFRTTAVSLITVLALSVLWSFPILSSGGRSFLAFGQHYALRKFETGQVAVDPWLNWLSILHKDAPDTNSISDILRHYPGILIGHISANAHDFLKSIYNILSAPFSQGIFSAALVTLALLFLARNLFSAHNIETPARQPANKMGAILFLLLASAPSCISTLSIYPRAHYTLIIFSCCSLLLAVLLSNQRIARAPAASVLLLVALCLLLPQPTGHDRVNFSSIMDIRNSTTVHKMLEVDGGWCIYLSCQFIFATDIPGNISASQYIEQNNVDAVMVSARMKEYATGISDKSLKDFLETASQHGWSSIPLRNGSTLLKKL